MKKCLYLCLSKNVGIIAHLLARQSSRNDIRGFPWTHKVFCKLADRGYLPQWGVLVYGWVFCNSGIADFLGQFPDFRETLRNYNVKINQHPGRCGIEISGSLFLCDKSFKISAELTAENRISHMHYLFLISLPHKGEIQRTCPKYLFYHRQMGVVYLLWNIFERVRDYLMRYLLHEKFVR